ncbi:small ribosomal subunit Rsm22 family protein [Bacillus cereus]|uniref:small ribosomal subunit Rsm22 family protein n=1 Tax=Bacillus cereus TaxID=1396 RepID=UPI00366C6025
MFYIQLQRKIRRGLVVCAVCFLKKVLLQYVIQVLLDLCEPDERLRRRTVTKRHGDLYKAARDADWGDPWPPEADRPAS